MAGGTGTLDERNLGEKFLYVAKYVGKNFWKVLPVGSAINYEINKAKKEKEENSYCNPIINFKNMAEETFHVLYGVTGGLLITAYVANHIVKEASTPKGIKEKTEQVNIINKNGFVILEEKVK